VDRGEELGLPEVIDIPAEKRQDPIFIREKGAKIGRDGCRVPMPWTSTGTSCGFSPEQSASPHLPIPSWYADFSAEAEDNDATSTLNMYRQALHLRRQNQTAETMEWIGEDDRLVHYTRPGGWEVLMNVAAEDGVLVPKGKVTISSGPLAHGRVPINTTVWVKQ
jgi:alpha-glucosidase